MTERFFIHAAAALMTAALSLTVFTPAAAQTFGPGSGYGPVAVAVTPVTAEEAQTLQFMREEEKLARDVYTALFQKWNLVTFQYIAASEQTHFDAIGTLLARYSIADPAQGLSAGVYSNPKLTALYSELMAKGTQSAQDALEVGVLIEKTDIADLENALKGTIKLDIKRVYTNLMSGSYNHLDAFETGCEVLASAR